MRPGHTLALAAGALAAFATGLLLMGGQRRPKHCVFCAPLDRIVYEDAEFIAFHDIKPDAALHLLVIPREHRGTVRELTPQDLPMVRRMHEIGRRLLEERGFSGDLARFGFHRPPFNSIHHLHMHCLGLPFLPRRAGKMFPQAGSPWFISAGQLCDRLRAPGPNPAP
ncbi:hypothetical protein LPJ61_002397 [Coemansia biformis]|uniref:HIT domain-containing protein n=1 Tax=Coemansia biformis TaxID=1286918 RepID=A0A9W7YCK0_9FUNG|nr:hypothetical protein LPJ61_002397 [Coemansia biformis]